MIASESAILEVYAVPLKIYCVKCRDHTDSQDVRPVVMKNGKNATEAICSVCGTKKFRLGKLPEDALVS